MPLLLQKLVCRKVSIKFKFIHLDGERRCESKVSAQEHNKMSSAKARTRTARYGVERTIHEAIEPPQGISYTKVYCI